jgi:lactoylglutathione lyase
MKKLFIVGLLLIVGCKIKAQMAKPRINHMAFSVLDLQKSVRFYQQVIGLDTIPEPFHDGRHAWFDMGGHSQLHLIQNPGPLVVPSKNTHLCFSVPSVNQFVETLKKAGVPFEDWPGKKGAITIRTDQVRQIYLQDPDGYWLEVNDAKQ